MQLRIFIKNRDGSRELDTTPWCIIEWERKYKRSFVDDIASASMEEWAFLAWEAVKAAGGTVAPFEEWCRALEDVTIVPANVDPTNAAPSAAS